MLVLMATRVFSREDDVTSRTCTLDWRSVQSRGPAIPTWEPYERDRRRLKLLLRGGARRAMRAWTAAAAVDGGGAATAVLAVGSTGPAASPSPQGPPPVEVRTRSAGPTACGERADGDHACTCPSGDENGCGPLAGLASDGTAM